MPGNLRRKLGNRRESDYLAMRRRLLRESAICKLCWDAIDTTLKPICSKIDTRGFGVDTAHQIPETCGPDCDHPKKANPWSGSIDHIIPVEKLPPGSPLLTSRQNGQVAHLVCNQRKGNRDGITGRAKYVSSGDWF